MQEPIDFSRKDKTAKAKTKKDHKRHQHHHQSSSDNHHHHLTSSWQELTVKKCAAFFLAQHYVRLPGLQTKSTISVAHYFLFRFLFALSAHIKVARHSFQPSIDWVMIISWGWWCDRDDCKLYHCSLLLTLFSVWPLLEKLTKFSICQSLVRPHKRSWLSLIFSDKTVRCINVCVCA